MLTRVMLTEYPETMYWVIPSTVGASASYTSPNTSCGLVIVARCVNLFIVLYRYNLLLTSDRLSPFAEVLDLIAAACCPSPAVYYFLRVEQ